MSGEGFLRRWSRLKADGPATTPEERPAPAVRPAVDAPAPAVATAATSRGAVAEGQAPALPTLEDVARLDVNSDFSAFVTRGVDKDVRRLAMKKLFSDPHFKLIDGLDIYMDDYNKPDPISAAMLAALHHTKNLFAPLAADIKAAEAEAEANAPAAPAAVQAAEASVPPTDSRPVVTAKAGTHAEPASPAAPAGADNLIAFNLNTGVESADAPQPTHPGHA